MDNSRFSYDLEVDKKEVGQRIKDVRLSTGLTLEDFGERIGGVSKGAVYHWESGKNLPNKPRLERIAEMGNLSVDYLLYGKQVWDEFDNLKDTDKLSNEVKQIENLESDFQRSSLDVSQYIQMLVTKLSEDVELTFEGEELEDEARQAIIDELNKIIK